jgi:hypothetical protein
MRKQDHTVAGAGARSGRSSERSTPRERQEGAPAETLEVIEVVRTEPDETVAVALETQIVELQEKIKANEARIVELHEKIAANDARIAELGDLAKAIAALGYTLNDCQTRISDCQTRIGNLEPQTNRINTYLNNTQQPPLAPAPSPPEIDLVPLPTRDEKGIYIHLIGRGFAESPEPSNPKTVSIVAKSGDGSITQPLMTHTTSRGTLTDSTFTLLIQAEAPAQTYNVAATDATPNAQDWTGKLWSNSVAFVL